MKLFYDLCTLQYFLDLYLRHREDTKTEGHVWLILQVSTAAEARQKLGA